ncbi:MAG: glycoside hydrolase family 5 protein [Myxococcota bacterium]|nr:glycoside hydrolase family 5 protein [Myxococcota bacterium]
MRIGNLKLVWIAVGLSLACNVGVPGVPPAPGADASSFRLPALHAEPDPEHGGRIADAHGREVLLRGVNVNAFVEYAVYDASRFTTYPFTEADADEIASYGWNAVRLLLSWSRVEPQPGVYDDTYLDAIEAAVLALQRRGIYSIVDLHQDAWGPSLAARPDEVCPAGESPAFGWDGAPAWATFDANRRRCTPPLGREFSPAVIAAFQSFWNDAPAADGVGIRTHYVRMLGHVAARLSAHDAVAGYDVMNEPNVYVFFPGHFDALSDLYAQAFAEIRAAEDAAGHPHRMLFFEPSIAWGNLPGEVPPFPNDGQIVYAPHIYQGGLDSTPLDATPFERAIQESAEFYGGAPILSGEWGGDPRRAADPNDDYFLLHQRLQDEFRISATLWTWREACGDPHKSGDWRAGNLPYVWGLFDVDCAVNQVIGVRAPLASQLRRPALRAAPGRLESLVVDAAATTLDATGSADVRASFVAFLPGTNGRPPVVSGEGVESFAWRPAPGGGAYVYGQVRAGAWSLSLR